MPCNPQSAIAGLNSCQRFRRCEVRLLYVALTAGSPAMEAREPGQVRKEAAVSGKFHVPGERLARANGKSIAWVAAIDGRCTVFPKNICRDMSRSREHYVKFVPAGEGDFGIVFFCLRKNFAGNWKIPENCFNVTNFNATGGHW